MKNCLDGVSSCRLKLLSLLVSCKMRHGHWPKWSPSFASAMDLRKHDELLLLLVLMEAPKQPLVRGSAVSLSAIRRNTFSFNKYDIGLHDADLKCKEESESDDCV